jgi:hypothetical protein
MGERSKIKSPRHKENLFNILPSNRFFNLILSLAFEVKLFYWLIPNDIFRKCYLCVFNVSNAFPYIVYKIEMKDKKYEINFVVPN